MGKWNRADVIALSSLIVAVVAIIVGVADPEVRCLVGLESCPSSQTNQTSHREQEQNDGQPKSSSRELTQNNEKPKSSPPISNTTGVNYAKLRDLLAAGEWKEADLETSRAMIQAANKVEEGWLTTEDIDNFPCEDLRIIDQLWRESSQGKFGLSVQKEIWQSNGSPDWNSPAENWRKFYIEIGWKKEESGIESGYGYVMYNDLGGFKDVKSAKRGNLPLKIYERKLGDIARLRGTNPGEGVYEISVAQRLVTCKI